MANIKQVAELATLSVSCVSKYLRDPNSVRQSSREKIEKAIAELRYTPSSMARSLRTKRTGIIKIIMHSITNSFFAELFELLRKCLDENGLTAVLQVIEPMESLEFQPSDFVLSDGIIMCFPENDSIFESFQAAAPEHYPIVCIHAHKPAEDITSIIADVKTGMQLVTDYLISMGCKSFAYIGGPGQSVISILKFNGFSDALSACNGEVRCTEVKRGTYDLKSGYNQMLEFLKNSELPDAIVCENDNIAAGVLHCLIEHDISVPSQVRITGYDNIPLSEMIYPSFTSVDLRLEELCSAACSSLTNLLESKSADDQLFAPWLIVRKS